MANFIVQKDLIGAYRVLDVDKNIVIFAAENESVAKAFAANGQDTKEAFDKYRQQDINYEGGIDTAPKEVSFRSAVQEPVYGTPKGGSVTYLDTNSPESRAELDKLQAQVDANRPQYKSVLVKDEYYQGGYRRDLVEIPKDQSSGTSYTPQTPQDAAKAVAQANAEQQAVDSMYIISSDGTKGLTVAEQRAVDSMTITTVDSTTAAPPASSVVTKPDPQAIEDESSWGVVTPQQEAFSKPLRGPDPLAIEDESSWGVVTPAQERFGLQYRPEQVIPGENGDIYLNAAGETIIPSEAPWVDPGDGGSAGGAGINAGKLLAQQQAAVSSQRSQIQSNDWRVRLQLAPNANYLYKSNQPGILQPLVPTDGIIFPYTPKIDVSYRANYQSMDLTHSNYKSYFYQGSEVSDIGITCMFTAQDTAQANYLLAVIHFFKSATKMFYGSNDPQRGSPPPLVFLSGLGQYQFNQHPCVITDFTYSLPDDVDYIRAQTTNSVGLNLSAVNSSKQSVTTNAIFAGIQRLATAFTTKGALPQTPFGSTNAPNLANGSPTYVPTKINISVKLLPVVSRQKVSQQFSMSSFASGNGLKGGFW